MDLRIIYLPSGGLAETHGNVVRLTTPSAGALAAHRLTRREIQAGDRGRGRGGGWAQAGAGSVVADDGRREDDRDPQDLVLEL